MAEVSVLVAVYNAEAYLPECLDSLLGQTLSDLQIICIDDCSTDRSAQLLDDYARRDHRIEVIHLEQNLGPSGARNRGLSRAAGRYVCMVDADDWLSPDALEQAVTVFAAHQQTDGVLFQMQLAHSDGSCEAFAMPDFTVLTGEEAFRLSLSWQIHGLYMLRSELQRRYPYDDQCGLYGDETTTRLHFLASREIRQCAGTYYYRQHAVSATHRVTAQYFERLAAHESLRRQMAGMGAAPALLAELESMRWLALVDACHFYHQNRSLLSAEDRHKGMDRMRHAWHSMDRTALKKETTAKFGYRLCSSWPLFRLQEWAYFTLRGLLRR